MAHRMAARGADADGAQQGVVVAAEDQVGGGVQALIGGGIKTNQAMLYGSVDDLEYNPIQATLSHFLLIFSKMYD